LRMSAQEKKDLATIRQNVTTLQDAQELTGMEAAKKMQISDAFYSQMFRTGSRRLSVAHLVRVARVLRVNPSKLLENV